jgi:hypothetical protein
MDPELIVSQSHMTSPRWTENFLTVMAANGTIVPGCGHRTGKRNARTSDHLETRGEAHHGLARRQQKALLRSRCQKCAGRDRARCSHQACKPAGWAGELNTAAARFARTELLHRETQSSRWRCHQDHDAQRAAVTPIAMARAPVTCERVRYSFAKQRCCSSRVAARDAQLAMLTGS